MMEVNQERSNGKIIFISGPPYSGKTYLFAELSDYFPDSKLINYELYYKRGGFPTFYSKAIRLAKEGYLVFAESANSFVGSNHKNKPDLSDIDFMHILAWPSLRKHTDNMDRYESIFGFDAVRARSGGYSVRKLRDTVRKPRCNYHIFTGDNLGEIKKVVLNYAICD